MPRSTLSIGEAATVATICFGLFIVWSIQAVLAGFPQATFSDASNVTTVVIEVVLAACALVYLRGRDFDIASLYPRPDWRGAVAGTVLYAAVFLAGYVVTAPFAGEDGTAGTVAFSYSSMSMSTTILVAMVNGTFEEVFLLGVLARSLRGHGASIAIGASVLVRILYHLYQGPVGVLWILAFGLAVTVFYMRTGRLWPVVFAHMLADIVPVLLLEA